MTYATFVLLISDPSPTNKVKFLSMKTLKSWATVGGNLCMCCWNQNNGSQTCDKAAFPQPSATQSHCVVNCAVNNELYRFHNLTMSMLSRPELMPLAFESFCMIFVLSVARYFNLSQKSQNSVHFFSSMASSTNTFNTKDNESAISLPVVGGISGHRLETL